MASKIGKITLSLAALAAVIGVITYPVFFRHFYHAGAGHAYLEIVDAAQLDWSSMSPVDRAPYEARAKATGRKCAILMTFGQHVPMFLFIMITIGLMSRTICGRVRRLLRISFCVVWIVGMTFLALGVRYWGPAFALPQAIGPAFLIYLIAASFCGLILGIDRLVRRRRAPHTEPGALT